MQLLIESYKYNLFKLLHKNAYVFGNTKGVGKEFSGLLAKHLVKKYI